MSPPLSLASGTPEAPSGAFDVALLDLDGVVYVGADAVPGVPEARLSGGLMRTRPPAGRGPGAAHGRSARGRDAWRRPGTGARRPAVRVS